MKKATIRVIFIILITLIFSLTPAKIHAQCVLEPETLSIDDFCQQVGNDIHEQFKVKVSKDFLNNYRQGIENSKINIDSECGIEPGRRKDTTSDPANVIWHFPTGESTCLGQKYKQFRVEVLYNPPGADTVLDQLLCQVEGYVTPNQPSCNVTVLPINGIGDINSTWEISVTNIVTILTERCIRGLITVTHPDRYGNMVEWRPQTGGRGKGSPIGVSKKTIKYDRAGSYEVFVTSDGTLACKTQFNVAPDGATPIPTNTPVPSATPPPCSSPYRCERTTSCSYSFPGYDCPTNFICCAPDQTGCNQSPCLGVNKCDKAQCKNCLACLPSLPPIEEEPPVPVPSLAPLCEQIDSKYQSLCKECVEGKHWIWTAIGCLPTDFDEIVSNYILKYGIGIAGGIAFLYFLYGAFLILTSAGNAEKITQAKEIIISAISGLILIIFSVFLLKVIGVDILKIPGFGG